MYQKTITWLIWEHFCEHFLCFFPTTVPVAGYKSPTKNTLFKHNDEETKAKSTEKEEDLSGEQENSDASAESGQESGASAKEEDREKDNFAEVDEETDSSADDKSGRWKTIRNLIRKHETPRIPKGKSSEIWRMGSIVYEFKRT